MTPKQLSRARAVQALYQWLVSGDDLGKIEEQFLNRDEPYPPYKISKAYFSNLFLNIPKNITLLDEIIEPSLDRVLMNWDQLNEPFCIWECMSLNFSQKFHIRLSSMKR